MKLILATLTFLLLVQITSAQNWQLVGLEDYEIEHVYAKGDTIWAGTVDSSNKSEIYYSFNGGDQWQKVEELNEDGWFKLIKVSPYNSQEIYATAANGRGFKSSDGGKSWELVLLELEPWPQNTRMTDIFISPNNKNTLFAIIRYDIGGFRTDNLFRSDDRGKNWQPVETGFPSSSHGSTFTIALDPIDSLKIYASVSNEFGDWFFYVSNDRGQKWSLESSIGSLHILPHTSNADTIYLFPGPLVSYNNGLTWQSVLKEIINPDSLFQPYITSSTQMANYPYDIFTSIIKWDSSYSVRETYGILRKANGIDSWTILQDSDKLKLVSSYNPHTLFFDKNTNTLFVGTKKGLYFFQILTSLQLINYIPVGFKLNPNYPNPFNHETIISYQLPFKDKVILKIFDISGKEIKTLINEEQSAGEHTVIFNAGLLASGIYIFRIKTFSGFSQSRKMILIK